MSSNNLPYISIRSVLYDISTNMEDVIWNESDMLEWAIRGFRKLKMHSKYQHRVQLVPILNHKGQLQPNTRYVNQVLAKTSLLGSDLSIIENALGLTENGPSIQEYMANSPLPQQVLASVYGGLGEWELIKPNTSSFIQTIDCNENIPAYLNPTSDELLPTGICEASYSIDPNMIVTTTFANGVLLVSYLSYITDINGDTMVPDNEDLKEAIFHYCMYRYWLKNVHKEPQLSRSERDWNLKRFEILAMKALSLNIPSLDKLENLLNQRSSLKSSVSKAQGGFGTLGDSPVNNFQNG